MAKNTRLCKRGHDLDKTGTSAGRWCLICRRTYRRERKRDDYKQVFETVAHLQGQRTCAICGRRDQLDLDHNHKTGLNRGLLCRSCNMAIGLLGDDIRLLREAINYLRKKPRPEMGFYPSLKRPKMQYNSTRADHTIEHRKGEHGKKY